MKKTRVILAAIAGVFAVWWIASSPTDELRISGPVYFSDQALAQSEAVDRSADFAKGLRHTANGLPNFDDIVFMDGGATALATGTDGKIWAVALDAGTAEPLVDVPLMPAGMHKAGGGKNGAYFCSSYYHGETYPADERVGLYYFDATSHAVTPVVLDVPDTTITPGEGRVYADGANAPTLKPDGTNGRPLAFCNDLEISEDGNRIYFSEPFSYGHPSMGGGTVGEAITLANNGRLWRHDLTTGETRLIAEGFNFIDGLLYDQHPDDAFEQSMLVSQTASFKLTRFYLRGPKAGTAEVVIEGLPGMADGIDRSENGDIWTGLIKMRSGASDWIHANPWIKPLLLRLPEFMLPVTRATGIMAFSADGSKIKYFAHYDGPATSSIASVLPGPEGLYIAAVGSGKKGLPLLPWPEGFGDAAPGFTLMEASIQDIQTAIRDGDTTCTAVIDAYLQRIEAYDKSTGLNAITVLNPRARAKAAAVDQRLQSGAEMGPLFCAPMLVKDNFDTHDMVTSGGSIALKNDLPPDDAFMVKQIRDAGAIIVAKTNMAEWAFSPRQSVSSSYGTTANAYALGHVPAGSSGGTASGVAANFAAAGLGSDTGNSIRGPSSHLALFGIRATVGLTSRDGVIPLAFDRDVAGPMTRSVADGALIFGVVAAYDPADPTTEHGKNKHETDYTRYLDKAGLKGARIGVLRALAPEDSDPEILALFEKAISDMHAAGATIIDDIDIPNFEKHRAANNFCRRFRYDMYQYLKSRGPNVPFLDVNTVLETGEYSPDAKGGLEFFSKYPLDVAPENWETSCPGFQKHEGRQAYLADTLAGMEAAGVDALIYPSWTHPPATLARANEDYKGDNSQIVAPSTGLPAVSVPMGFSYGKLPAGLQILGKPYSEGLLIKYAYAYEQATKHRRPPAAFPVLRDTKEQ